VAADLQTEDSLNPKSALWNSLYQSHILPILTQYFTLVQLILIVLPISLCGN